MTQVNLVQQWFGNSGAVRRVANHTLLQGRAKITVQVLGNPRTAGLLKVAVVPAARSSWIMRSQNNSGGPIMAQLAQMRGHTFDFSQSESREFDFPLTTPGGGIWLESNSLEPLLGPAGGPVLVLGTMKNAVDITLVTPPPISIMVRMELVPGYTLTGPTSTFYTTVTSGIPPKEVGQVTKMATLAAGVAGAFTDLPGVGWMASTAEKVAKGAAKVASSLGYSAPINPVSDSRFSMQPNSTMGHFARSDAMPSGSFDPNVAVVVDSASRGLGEEDWGLVGKIAEVEGVVIGGAPGTLEWGASATAG